MVFENEYMSEDTIRKIIGRNKIKYTTLTELFDKQITKLDTFIINIDSILLDLHKFLDSIDKSTFIGSEIISSAIINIVAHYRYYFSINGWYPNIYLLGDKNDNHSVIRYSLEIVSIILKYIDNTYFIDTSNLDTGLVIKHFVSDKSDNLILTRDEFDLMHLSKYTSILRSNRDKSKYYRYDNWQTVLCKKYNEKYNEISWKLLNIILCFSGAHGRKGVKGLGYRTMMKKIYNGLNNKLIINDRYSSIDDFISDMNSLLKKYDLTNAISNFNLYDINSNYSKFITKATEKRLDSYIEDKFSKKDLMTLNTKYFTGFNSLMLEELMTKPMHFKHNTKW